MWTRKELKGKAKVSFKANYWKAVLVALILVLLVGGVGTVSPRSGFSTFAAPSGITSSQSPDDVSVEIKDGKIKVDVDDADGDKVHVNVDSDDIQGLVGTLNDLSDKGSIPAMGVYMPGVALAGLSLTLIALALAAIIIALYVFVLSPLEVGARRFFVRNLNQRAEVKEVAFGYDNNYKEVVKTLFLRTLFVFLWSLLLIIPGIYKSYQYRMIPYLLAEDPTMTKDRAFAESKRMMDGQKWNTFVLDLSFLGWNILSVMTLGILGAFYVCPYQAQTNAALYEKLRYGLPAPEPVAQAAPVAPGAPTPATGNPAATAPMPNAPTQTMPVIVSESQPPVPPFAAVGAEPAGGSEGTENAAGSDSPNA